jgi:hypothetical protein
MSTKSFTLTLLAVLAIVLAAWLLVAASGCAAKTISADDLPPAVRSTLERETAGGRVVEIERVATKGKVNYTADAQIGGKNYEIVIAEDGKLVSKELE